MRIVHQLQSGDSWPGLALPVPARRRRSAMAWCRDCVVEAFAGYAHAMHPSFADPGEEGGWHEQQLDELLRHPGVALAETAVPWLYALDPWTPEEPFELYREPKRPGWLARAREAMDRFRAYLRRDRLARRTAADLSQLDDYSLKDIGLHRSQIGSIARHGDPLRL